MLVSLLVAVYSCKAMEEDEYISHNNIPTLSLLAAARLRQMAPEDLEEYVKRHGGSRVEKAVVNESYEALNKFLENFLRPITDNYHLCVDIPKDSNKILSKAMEAGRLDVIQVFKQLMNSNELYDFLCAYIQKKAYNNCEGIEKALSYKLINYRNKIYGWPLLCTVITHLSDPWDFQCVSILLKNGADANAQKDLNGDTALMCASHNCDLLELLLKYGAKPNLTNDAGDTLLAKVVRKGQTEAFKFLIKKEISIDTTIDNVSLLDYAKKHQLYEIARMLRIQKQAERNNNN